MIWCVTIYFVTTSNALKFYFNVVFLFYSFLVLSVLYLYHWICKPNVISLKVDASSPSLPPSFFQIYNVHPEFAQWISAANNAFQKCRIQWKLTSCLFQYFNGKKDTKLTISDRLNTRHKKIKNIWSSETFWMHVPSFNLVHQNITQQISIYLIPNLSARILNEKSAFYPATVVF